MASALMGEVRAQQSVIPFLYKPFNGSYAVNAHFDHDTPNQQTNGFVRTFLGEARYDISYDGHEGWDYALPNRTEVLAAASGRAWSQWYDPEHSNVGYGYYVRIDHDGHGQGYRTIYGHLTADLALAPGGYIGRGAIIGLSGNTGNVQGANGGYHLHFGACQIANANVRENCWVGPTSTRFVDPNGWYGSGVDPLNNGLVSQWLWADQGPWLRFTSRLGEGTNRQDREVYIDVRNVNGTYPVRRFSVVTDQDGNYRGSANVQNKGYELSGMLPGTYDLYAKPSGYLAKKIGATSLVLGINQRDFGLASGGDYNGDNVIDVFDLGIFAARYRTTNPCLDLSGDFYINVFDLGIFASNYGRIGDGGRWSSPTPGCVTQSGAAGAYDPLPNSLVSKSDIVGNSQSSAAFTDTAHLSLVPNVGAYKLGDSVEVSIVLDTRGAYVEGVDAIVQYDPSVLEALTLTRGTIPEFQFYPYNEIDPLGGIISLSGAPEVGGEQTPVQGDNLVFGRVVFSVTDSVPSITTLYFDSQPGDTTDSNVAENGKEVLGSVTNAAYCLNSPSMPDLMPYAPFGMASPLVPSTQTPTQVVTDTLYAGQPSHFKGYFINGGSARILSNFTVELWIDGSLYQTRSFMASDICELIDTGDWILNVAVPGWHTIWLVVDANDDINEADETNNIWQGEYYWESIATNTPTPTYTMTSTPTPIATATSTTTPTPTATNDIVAVPSVTLTPTPPETPNTQLFIPSISD